jgi:hypothetical protein
MDTHCIQIEPVGRWVLGNTVQHNAMQRSATATPSVIRGRERGSEEHRIRGSCDNIALFCLSDAPRYL